MNRFYTCSWFGLLLTASVALGDISIRITDMADRPIPGTNGGKAYLSGLDARGSVTLGPKYADSSGAVQFTTQEISASTQGAFSFVVYTSGGNARLQGKLYDPFGPQWTYIQFQAGAAYDFTIPTPTVGDPQPRIAWTKNNLQLTFNIDWGQRSNRDFWFTRVILQKKATQLAQAGSDFGLIPTISDAWITGNNLTANDGGLASGKIGNLHLTGSGYDQTFLAKKSVIGPSAQYQIYVVNCLWGRDLEGVYDPAAKTYTVAFDSTTVFADTTAPAWDGYALKPDIDYFAVLQGETWVINNAGANGGLACAFGPPVVQSLLYPFRLQPQTENFRFRSISAAGGNCTLELMGAAGGFVLECSTDLKSWQRLSSGTLAGPVYVHVDKGVPKGKRFYRLRRAEAPNLSLSALSWFEGGCDLLVSGPPGPFTLQYTISLSKPNWQNLVSTNVTRMPFYYTDFDALDNTRFYRVRQP